tara:strand:- start:3820 stop:4545 length:726 start_codon:yes stop_codon:yes gene_type:complete
MNENKTAKYFKYAIGEIVLVVIGILIALQINNLNDKRKLQEQEKTYYCKVSEDLKTDIENIDRSILSIQNRQEATKRLLTNLLKIQKDKSVILKDYLNAIRSFDFIPTKAAIIDITSSGKLENLKNLDLNNQILQHYSELDYRIKVIEGNNEQLSQKVFEYSSYTDFGIHELKLYKNAYGKELNSLLKSKEWQRNPNDEIFKHLLDHMNMTMIICQREQDVLNQIKISAQKLNKTLTLYCK